MPSNQLVFDSNRTGNYEIWSVSPNGSALRRLTNNPTYDSWWPRISPDRTQIIFYRTPKGVHDGDYRQTSLWKMSVDGSNLRELLPVGAYGWTWQGHAQWSPDGTRLVMFGGSVPQIYVTDANGRNPKRITGQGGLDPSWTPNGSILFIGCPVVNCQTSQYEIYRVAATGGPLTRLTTDLVRDQDPEAAPNGSAIAWLRGGATSTTWNVYRMLPDGSGQGSITSSDNTSINSKPAWSPDSSLIYFHRWVQGTSGSRIWKMQPGGTGLVQLPLPPAASNLYDDEYPDASTF